MGGEGRFGDLALVLRWGFFYGIWGFVFLGEVGWRGYVESSIVLWLSDFLRRSLVL